MCGILGAVGDAVNRVPVDECLELLRHRGPDSAGLDRIETAAGPVLLGHTRLAILDLSPAGHQPMCSRDKRWWVTFNGEIYNHTDLRRNLPIDFRGQSDTETLVESLAAAGIEKTIQRLNGMFAFAALDTHNAELHLVRDPFGIKPLYYSQLAEQGLVFASELRALRSAAWIRPEVDHDALQCFLTLRFVPSPRTLLRSVRRLPPGHRLTVNLHTGGAVASCYVEPTIERFRGGIDDAVDLYRDVLGRAVERHFLSDVPVGILLSGGIDSALIAALAKEQGHTPPCFTVGFEGQHAECEVDDAQATAQALGLRSIPIRIQPEDLITALDDVMESLEEPLVTTSSFAMWHLVRRARDDVVVALSGQGSDEPWGGYTRYQSEILRRLVPVPSLLRLLGPLRSIWQRWPEGVGRAIRSLPVSDPAHRFCEAYAVFDAATRADLTGRPDDGGALDDIRYWLAWGAPAEREPVEDMMRLDSHTGLSDDLLLYTDKISMAFALEVRVPFLDIEVVRFIESLPRSFRVGLNRRKIVHKMMAERYLPAAIVRRRKKNFAVPFAAWSRGPLRERVESLLLDVLPHHGPFRRPAIERLWRDHLAGVRDLGRQVYALFSLADWWRRHAV